jgi:hypothetical protein
MRLTHLTENHLLFNVLNDLRNPKVICTRCKNNTRLSEKKYCGCVGCFSRGIRSSDCITNNRDKCDARTTHFKQSCPYFERIKKLEKI